MIFGAGPNESDTRVKVISHGCKPGGSRQSAYDFDELMFRSGLSAICLFGYVMSGEDVNSAITPARLSSITIHAPNCFDRL